MKVEDDNIGKGEVQFTLTSYSPTYPGINQASMIDGIRTHDHDTFLSGTITPQGALVKAF